MARINTLSEMLNKEGLHYIENFLSNDLIITEKLDTYRILFEKKDDKLVFYKKDNKPLNLIERTLTNVWEDAIIELNTIIGDIKLPEGLTFGLAYTPVERPIRLPYSNIPKYILTDITLRKNNKIVETYDYEEVKRWASTLKIGRPPIIFEGILSEEQKNVIINYGQGNYNEIKQDSLVEIIESLFNDTYSKEDIIEGIILKSNKGLMQLESYEFSILNEAYQNEKYTRDFYDIILLNLNSFLDDYKIPLLEGKTPDEIYLEIASDIFNNFCQKNPNILKNIKEEYLNPPSYGYYGRLNLLLIKNKKTVDILEKNDKIFESLFRIILSSLRKPKKEYGLLTETTIEKFNTFVYLIKDTINSKLFPNKEEEPILNEDIEEETPEIINEQNVVVDEINKKQPTDLDNMRIISSIQKTFDTQALNINKGETKAVVYVTDCLPFTKAQEENILKINKYWKCPVIIGSISNARRVKGKKFVFSDNLIKAQLDSIGIFNKEIVPAYFLLESWDLTEIFQYCRPKYEPIALITDKDKKSEFSLQLYFEEKIMGGRICVEKEFNIGEIENTNKLVAFRAIEDSNINKFKEYTPQAIWNLWDSMVSEYKVWAGQFGIDTGFKETALL